MQFAKGLPEVRRSADRKIGNSRRAEKAISLLGGCPVCHMTRPSAPLKDGFDGGEGEREAEAEL